MPQGRYRREKEEIESLARELREFTRERQRISNLHQESAQVLRPLGKMLERNRRSLWGKMTKVGYILVALPIPIITEVTGAILIAVGFFMKKIEGGGHTLRRVYDEFDRTIEEIHRLRRSASS
jgi:YD repeat-containing protein